MSDTKTIRTAAARKKSRRDRSERDDNDNEVNLLHRLQEFQHKCHSLRISASNIAAMTGFHPFCSLPELMLKLVYQGPAGQALLRHDAKLLQLEMVTEEAILLQLAHKASAETGKALQMALQVKMGTRKLDTIQTAHRIKQKIVEEAKKTNKLSAVELRLLQEGARSAVDTGYGTSHEDTALDLYEQTCGWPVQDRNAEILLWPFQRVPTFGTDNDNNSHTMIPSTMEEVHAATVVPIRPPKPCWKRDDEVNNNAESEQEESKAKRLRKEGDDLSDGIERNRTESINEQSLNEPDDDDGKNHVNNDVMLISSRDSENNHNVEPEHELTSVKETEMEASQSSDRMEIEHFEPNNNQKVSTEPNDDVVQTPVNNDPVISPLSPLPFFVILGSVDGIREEMFPTASNQPSNTCSPGIDDDWQIRQVVVECKHRMTKIHPVPPLYEQIQTTAYCLMYGVTEADIIQVIRKERCPQHTPKATQSSSSNDRGNNNNVNNHDGQKDASILNHFPSQESSVASLKTGQDEKPRNVAQVEIAVNRVSIDDPLFQHRYHWDKVVLPRLCSFVDAVYRIRASDEKRYGMLIASAASPLPSSSSSSPQQPSQEAWRLLLEECPWLQFCDTARWQVM